MPTPLNIKDPAAYDLASAIARHTGKTLTRVVIDALRAEAERLLPGAPTVDDEQVKATLARLHAFPIVDDRNADQVLYDEKGLPA